jgi:hypothetical protein
MYQGTTKYAMVPRTHFITVLVLAREDIRSIQLVSRTELVHAQTGRALGSDPGRTRELLDNRARGLIRGFGYDLNEACLLLKDEQDYKGLEFLRLTQVGRYDVVTECLRKARKTPSGTMLEAVTWSDAEGLRLTRMVTFLLELQTDGVTDKAEFDLPATPPNTPKDRPLSLIQR